MGFNLLKTPIRGALSMVGLQLQRIKHDPYEELLGVPPFTEHSVQLLGRPFMITDSRSFFFSYREIFVEEIYRFNASRPAPRIIDCGSNYGTSIVYFKSLYPRARITGIEADPKIFELLKGNTAHLNVDLRNIAVSNNNEPLQFFADGKDGGRTAHPLEAPKATVRVEAITLDQLIDGPVDFLKIDIEGSEVDSIEACTKLSQVDQLFIEYHSFHDTPQTLGRMLDKLAAEGFRYYIHKQFCSPRPLVEAALQGDLDLQLNIFARRSLSREVAGEVPRAGIEPAT
jgi:FkbM family methyltransferase